ncbi:PDDEXK nuclease domain-containing protein [Arthrobacter sp. MW3 TE3886]|uniref:PDDEXK nuclease domain-containing protein n=1 Tax=Arthrobacter sp. MW3 TE3886 TaxID=3156254 RepID=UPI003513FEFC
MELKAGKFKPEHRGQLNFYVAAVNDMLRLSRQAPTVGILVCGSRNDRTVRYALDGSAQPLTVTSYTYEALPVDEQATLPSPAAITAALEHDPASPLDECLYGRLCSRDDGRCGLDCEGPCVPAGV